MPIKTAYLRYAVCGCCLCIKCANCYNFSRTEFLLSAVCPPLPVFYRCFPTRTNGSHLFWDRQNSPDGFFAKGHFFCNVAIMQFSDQSQGSFRCRTLHTVRLIRFAFRHSSNRDTFVSPLFAIKGHPQPWKLKIPIFWHHCLNSPFILSWLLLGINTISHKTSSFISESVCRNQAVFTLCYFYKNSAAFLLFLCIPLWIVAQETRAVSK